MNWNIPGEKKKKQGQRQWETDCRRKVEMGVLVNPTAETEKGVLWICLWLWKYKGILVLQSDLSTSMA